MDYTENDQIKSERNRATMKQLTGKHASENRPKFALLLPTRATNPVIIPHAGWAHTIAVESPIPLSLDGCRWVEAWMRLERGTLGSLSPATFKAELGMALACIAEAGPIESEQLARSFGL